MQAAASASTVEGSGAGGAGRSSFSSRFSASGSSSTSSCTSSTSSGMSQQHRVYNTPLPPNVALPWSQQRRRPRLSASSTGSSTSCTEPEEALLTSQSGTAGGDTGALADADAVTRNVLDQLPMQQPCQHAACQHVLHTAPASACDDPHAESELVSDMEGLPQVAALAPGRKDQAVPPWVDDGAPEAPRLARCLAPAASAAVASEAETHAAPPSTDTPAAAPSAPSAPTTGAPSTSDPITSARSTSDPITSTPGTSAPGTSGPNTSAPSAVQPGRKTLREMRRLRSSGALVLVKRRWLQDLLQHMPLGGSLEFTGLDVAGNGSSPDHSNGQSLGPSPDSSVDSEDVVIRQRDLDHVLGLLPERTAKKYRMMQGVMDTTAGFAATAGAAIDPDGFYAAQQVDSMLKRFYDEQEGSFRLHQDTDHAKEAAGRRHLIDNVIGGEDLNAAAAVIQRAYRAFKRRRALWKIATFKRSHMMDREWNIAKSRFRALSIRQDSQYSISPIMLHTSKEAEAQGEALPSPSALPEPRLSRKDSRPALRLMTAYGSAKEPQVPLLPSPAGAPVPVRGLTSQISAPQLSSVGGPSSSNSISAAPTPTGASHPPHRSSVSSRSAQAFAAHLQQHKQHPHANLGAAEPGATYRSIPTVNATGLALHPGNQASQGSSSQRTPLFAGVLGSSGMTGGSGGAVVRMGNQGFMPLSAGSISTRNWTVDPPPAPHRSSHNGAASVASAGSAGGSIWPSFGDTVPMLAMDRASGRGIALQYMWRQGGITLGPPAAPQPSGPCAQSQLPHVHRDFDSSSGAVRERDAVPHMSRPVRRASDSGAGLGPSERRANGLPSRTSNSGVSQRGRVSGRSSNGASTPVIQGGGEGGMRPRTAWSPGSRLLSKPLSRSGGAAVPGSTTPPLPRSTLPQPQQPQLSHPTAMSTRPQGRSMVSNRPSDVPGHRGLERVSSSGGGGGGGGAELRSPVVPRETRALVLAQGAAWPIAACGQ